VQGADAGRYTDSDIYAVRILAMEPTTHLSYGPGEVGIGGPEQLHFFNHANERLRILGEIPLRKFGADGKPILDVDGNPDTSFLAKIPADVPFTFQTLDKDGLVLNMAQTWHQVRPGEIPTAAAAIPTRLPGRLLRRQKLLANTMPDLTTTLSSPRDTRGNPALITPLRQALDVEYYRDIKPILQRSCVKCHNGAGQRLSNLLRGYKCG
jgi:hypothetical protein